MANPFIILFTARSGSTALYGNLRSLPNVRMRAEVFGNRMLPGDLEQNDDNRIKFLRRYWSPFKNGAKPDNTKFAGFKFQVAHGNTQFSRPARLVKVALQYDPKVVILRRQNILKQAISALNAKRLMDLSKQIKQGRGSAHILPEDRALIDELKNTPLQINIGELMKILAGVRNAYARLDRMAEGFGEVHNITYEDYLKDRDQVVRGVLNHIGIDPASYQPSDAFLKITSDSLKEVVANYTELQKSLRGTPYAAMV